MKETSAAKLITTLGETRYRAFLIESIFFKSQIVKKGNHVRSNHILNVKNRISGFKINKIKVNSYHNYTVYSLPKYFNLIVRIAMKFFISKLDSLSK